MQCSASGLHLSNMRCNPHTCSKVIAVDFRHSGARLQLTVLLHAAFCALAMLQLASVCHHSLYRISNAA